MTADHFLIYVKETSVVLNFDDQLHERSQRGKGDCPIFEFHRNLPHKLLLMAIKSFTKKLNKKFVQ